MLCYKQVVGIDFSNFQERFDLEGNGVLPNDFDCVPRAVMYQYPHVKLVKKDFSGKPGAEKLDRIRELLSQGKPCLISIALSPQGGWHIAPVVEIDEKDVSVLYTRGIRVPAQLEKIPATELVNRHEKWRGGGDILWLDV